MNSKLMGLKINGGLVKIRIENLNKLRAIVSLILRVIMYQSKPIPLSNPIKKYMAISIDITKDPRKILFSKNNRCHELKFGEKERNLQTSPGIRGGKQRSNCTEQSTKRSSKHVADLRSTGRIDH